MNRIDFKKLCGYSIGTPKKFEKKINYVLAGNGGVEIRENEIAHLLFFGNSTTKFRSSSLKLSLTEISLDDKKNHQINDSVFFDSIKSQVGRFKPDRL